MYKNKKKLICFLVLVLTISVFAVGCGEKTEPADSSKGTIVVGASGEFYPLNFMKNDELQGFEIDVWNEIASRTGYKVEYKTAKFAGLFGMLDAGQIDTICHQIAINAEREEKYSFTESYLNANYQLVTKKDSGLNKLEDFKGKKIGVVAGGLGDKMLQKVNEENNLNINIQGYEGTAAMDADLEMGRLDARLGPAIQTRATIKEQNLDFIVTDVVIFTETAAFPFKKGEESEAIINDVNEALESMKEDGTLSKLSMKWFEVDATK
ncbi:transporter substrate-binding domain-containing protein [Proteiniborus sp.]|uniref:transporter substrate-binding domain-containing protein n=1 Tax=Proteiniborus sp. TaxID=2079015 RepID=UPI0033341236